MLRRPKQRVTFVESGPGGDRPIGTITGGRGTLAFSPAPATGRRRIEAQFELAGIGAETKTVATFTPPSVRLGRPTHLTVRAIAPMRQGRATAARFRASAPRTSTRFGPLARLKRATGG